MPPVQCFALRVALPPLPPLMCALALTVHATQFELSICALNFENTERMFKSGCGDSITRESEPGRKYALLRHNRWWFLHCAAT